MKVLVTGSAGFIGSAVALSLLARGDEVLGIDSLNDYYDVSLKRARLQRLQQHASYTHDFSDIAERAAMETAFGTFRPQRVVNLAAQAGVRYGLTNPHAYASSNLSGFLNVIEGCREQRVEHLVYASTSSVYGANSSLPYSTHQSTEHPLSLYSATKKANEMMAHSYAHLFELPCTGLRFFTVYGPWSRPDMALGLFTRAILADEPIQVFNHGHHRRDFTYIDDIVEGVVRVLDRVATPNPEWDSTSPDPATSSAPYRLYNIGNNQSVELSRYIQVLEQNLGRKARIEMLPLQPGDVADTQADVEDLIRDTGFRPRTTVETGIARYVEWYRQYYDV